MKIQWSFTEIKRKFLLITSEEPVENDIPLVDRNIVIENEEREAEEEIQKRWKAMDQARRHQRLADNWPNRQLYEEQLKKIQNVNSRQGKFYFIFL